MEKIKCRPFKLEDVDEVVPLHLNSLQEGLLYDLGAEGIAVFYKTGLKSKNGFGFVAIDESGSGNEDKTGKETEKIIGLTFSTKNIRKLFIHLLYQPIFLKGLMKRIFRLKKLYSGNKIPIKQEFLFFFIDPKYRNFSTALQLIKLTDNQFADFGIKKYSLEVKKNNETANKLYDFFGFHKLSEAGDGEDKRIFYVKVPEKLTVDQHITE